MACRINDNGYVCKSKDATGKSVWLIKHDKYIRLQIRLPKSFIGKRVRIKVEETEEYPQVMVENI